MPAAGVKVLYSLSTLSLRSWKDFCTTGDNSSRHHRYHPSTALQVSTVHGSTGIIPPQPSRYQQFTALQVSSLHSPTGINSSRHYRYHPSTALQVSTVHGTTGIIPPQPSRYQQFTALQVLSLHSPTGINSSRVTAKFVMLLCHTTFASVTCRYHFFIQCFYIVRWSSVTTFSM